MPHHLLPVPGRHVHPALGPAQDAADSDPSAGSGAAPIGAPVSTALLGLDGLFGLRVSFSMLDEERIDEGIRRLAIAVRGVRRATGPRVAPAMS